jgi:hypothetical protein
MGDEKNTATDPKAELKQRIKAAREKSAAFVAEISDDEEIRELERQAVAEENKARDLPHIKKAEDEYGEIKWHNTPLGAIVVRKPNHLVFNRFMRRAQATGDKGMNENDVWRLVKSCICYPSVSRVEDMLEEYPAVGAILGNLVVDLGQGCSDELEKK